MKSLINLITIFLTLAQVVESSGGVSANSVMNVVGGSGFLAGVLALIPKLFSHQRAMRAAEDKARTEMAERFERELAKLMSLFQRSLEALNDTQNERTRSIRADLAAKDDRLFTVINNNTAAFNRMLQLYGPKLADPTTPTHVSPPSGA